MLLFLMWKTAIEAWGCEKHRGGYGNDLMYQCMGVILISPIVLILDIIVLPLEIFFGLLAFIANQIIEKKC